MMIIIGIISSSMNLMGGGLWLWFEDGGSGGVLAAVGAQGLDPEAHMLVQLVDGHSGGWEELSRRRRVHSPSSCDQDAQRNLSPNLPLPPPSLQGDTPEKRKHRSQFRRREIH